MGLTIAAVERRLTTFRGVQEEEGTTCRDYAILRAKNHLALARNQGKVGELGNLICASSLLDAAAEWDRIGEEMYRDCQRALSFSH